MKITLFTLLGSVMLMGTMATAQSTDTATPETAAASHAPATLPFKAPISGELAAAAAEGGSGSRAQFVFTVYDRATGGTKLFEETQTLQVSGANLYATVGSATRGGIPAHILAAHTSLYVEIARASAPWSPLTTREMLAFKSPSGSNGTNGVFVFVPVDPSICYTCGGAWPYLVGSWSTPLPGAYERGAGCGGSFTYASDTRPYLCSR